MRSHHNVAHNEKYRNKKGNKKLERSNKKQSWNVMRQTKDLGKRMEFHLHTNLFRMSCIIVVGKNLTNTSMMNKTVMMKRKW